MEVEVKGWSITLTPDKDVNRLWYGRAIDPDGNEVWPRSPDIGITYREVITPRGMRIRQPFAAVYGTEEWRVRWTARGYLKKLKKRHDKLNKHRNREAITVSL